MVAGEAESVSLIAFRAYRASHAHVFAMPALVRQMPINGATPVSAPGFRSHRKPDI